MAVILAVIAAVAAVALAWFAGVRRILNRSKRVARAVIVDPEEHTTMDARGAVRSVQAADLTLPAGALDAIWTPMHLERLARTYWRFLSRCTLGLVRVRYDDDGRTVVLLARPLALLRFKAPEYEMDAERGVVRWRIERGVLVSRAGHGGDGYLQIDVRRCEPVDADTARVHVEVEVANFYPALASGIARWFYAATQSRIHVIVTHGFLRSLARLDLAESVVGRYADAGDAVPDPPPRRASRRPRDRGRRRSGCAPIPRDVAAALLDGRAPAGIAFADGYPSQFSLEVMDILAGPRAATPAARASRRASSCASADGVVVGEIGYSLAESTAQLGYSIVEPCQGRGYATDALRALIAALRDDPRVRRITAETLVGHVREPAGHGEGAACALCDERLGEVDGELVELVVYEARVGSRDDRRPRTARARPGRARVTAMRRAGGCGARAGACLPAAAARA